MRANKVESLPLTRKNQIWYIIKEEPSLLFFANFTAGLFFLPLAFVATWGLISYSRVALSENVTGMQCFLSILYPSLAVIPSVVVAGLGVCGVYAVISRLTLRTTANYGEFWQGVKNNWKQFVIVHFIFGLLICLFLVNLGSYYYLDIDPTSKLIILIISSLLLFIFSLIRGYVLFQCTLFNNSLSQIMKNSFGFFGKRIGYNLLSYLVNFVMYVLIFFLPGWYKVIPIALIATYWISFESLLNYLICIDTLESKLPRELTTEFYHRGLENNESE